ncbi:MAG: DUF4179 domain-containing protein [Bacillota bacterium]
MMQRDDFENRLGQGLKRWAQAGEPTLDLEALVKQRLERGKEAAPAVSRTPGRPWVRWAGVAAAAALLALSATVTFPTWAGAAAGWPLVGPVVREIIMKDAGLKWAYDMGFIQQPLAEVTEDGVTVRVLGVVADRGRTTVIYQITGWEVPASSPQLFIAEINGTGVGSWAQPPVETPMGLVGTASADAIPTEEAELTLRVSFPPEKHVPLTLQVKRTAEASREVLVDQVQTIAGVGINVERVIYTPAETIVRYRKLGPQWSGSATYGQEKPSTPWLEVDGQRLMQTHAHGAGDQHVAIFPAVEGKAKLVFPSQIRSVAVDLRFPPEKGLTRTVEGVEITLDGWAAQGSVLNADFRWPEDTDLIGLGRLQVVDATGVVHTLHGGMGEGSSAHGGWQRRSITAELPAGVEPVAIRIPSLNFYQQGPWVFDLPR